MVVLPVPPSVNHYLRRTKWGVTLSEEAKAFKDEVRLTVKGRLIKGWVRVKINYYRPRKAGDIDGILKLTFDSLQGILYDNDKQIVELHVYRYDDKKYPRLEVTVDEIK